MDWDGEAEALVHGLRALSVLAVHAPIDVPRFARLNSVSIECARELMLTYENCGYARRVAHRELYVLTPLAIDLLEQRRSTWQYH